MAKSKSRKVASKSKNKNENKIEIEERNQLQSNHQDVSRIKQEEGNPANFRFQQLLPDSPLQQQQLQQHHQQQQRETLIFSDIYERQPQASTSYTYDLY